MNTINDRLEIICNSLFKGNKSAMAQAIGLQPTGLSNYLGNKRRSKPNVDMIANLVQFCRIDAFWLLTGEGEMLSTDNSQRSVAVVSSTISDNSIVANEVYSLLPTKYIHPHKKTHPRFPFFVNELQLLNVF